jgi:dipeptidyl aminopeptidase/acylaminoacyl peptidase
MRRLALAATVLAGIACAAAMNAQAPAAGSVPTIEQSLKMKSASTPRISPDGRWVAYEVTHTNWEDNAFERDLWIVSTSSGETRQLTRGKKSSAGAQWSPDSQWIAFVSDREGKRQIYLISPAGGEARALTKVETGVNSLAWAPDGKRIAFTSAEPESKAMKDRKEKYGEYDVVDGDFTMTHLWMLEVDARDADKMPEPQRLTNGTAFTVGGFAWSPDSTRIAFAATKTPLLSDSATQDISVLTLADRSIQKPAKIKGPNGNPVWSPDGKQIAFQTANGSESYYYTNNQVAVVAAEGGTPTVVTSSFDENKFLIAWAPEGIYFSAFQRTSSHLFRLDPGTRAVTRVSGPDALVASQFNFTRDYRQVAYSAALPNAFAELYVSPAGQFAAAKKMTAMADQYREFQLATEEVIEWKSTDGAAIEGVLIKPKDFDPTKKYPLLVVIHGGPTGVDRPTLSADRYYPIERFVAKGALVLEPNYRGSAGYGEKFRSLNVRNLGVGDYWDVISGVDYLIGKGYVDKERVGAMGWSEGGYISAFITASSDRFRAVSVGAGISDWMTYYVNTDIHPFTRQYLKATPWDDPEIYRKTSPISYVKAAKTPTLIQHGGNDQRVPLPNAYELRQALEDRGVPVKMVVYKGFGHPIDKPKQQRAVMEENYNWFSQWIWGEKPAETAKPAAKVGEDQ